jgi:hypothetical protein
MVGIFKAKYPGWVWQINFTKKMGEGADNNTIENIYLQAGCRAHGCGVPKEKKMWLE